MGSFLRYVSRPSVFSHDTQGSNDWLIGRSSALHACVSLDKHRLRAFVISLRQLTLLRTVFVVLDNRIASPFPFSSMYNQLNVFLAFRPSC